MSVRADTIRDLSALSRQPPAVPDEAAKTLDKFVRPPRVDHAGMDGLQRIQRLINAHSKYRQQCINLIASENITSPAVMRLQHNDLGHRYGDYRGIDPSARKYLGNRHIVPLEQYVIELTRQLFRAGYADIRPLSGHIAGEAALLALCRPGDTVLELDSIAGGHRLAEKLGVASLIQLKVEPLPFDALRFNIDIDACRTLVRRLQPRVVVLGSSSFLFPHPVTAIREILDELPESFLVYDASHVLGLIAGGRFQQPLKEGAHAVVASTHKTFCGPQGGIVLTHSRDLAERIGAAVHPALVTNHHLQRLPALGAACLEWLQFGAEHADAVIDNARAFADALSGEGLEVVGIDGVHTDSHTVLVATRGHGRVLDMAHHLEAAGIIAGPTVLPDRWGRRGIRFGVQEVTRRGLTREGTRHVARLIADVVFNRTDPRECRAEVREFARNLTDCRFALR